MCTVDQAGAAQLLRIGRRFISPIGPSDPVILPRHSRSAQSRRYLKPDFRCLRCIRSRPLASARTHYLQRCLRRTGSDVTHVTCDCPLLAAALDVSRLTRTVRRRHVTAADPLATGTFRRGLQITADLRADPGSWLAVDAAPERDDLRAATA
jgi:hypothetical protein